MKKAERVYIVGHPAAGKAYFSQYLADKLGYHFIDADMGLEHRFGLNLKEILGREGLLHYGKTQERLFDDLAKRSAIVVGLDCYLSQSPAIIEHLKNACVVFLKTSIETQLRRCGSRHEPLISEYNYEQVLRGLHTERNDFYHQISDIVLHADDGNIDRHVEAISTYFKKNDIGLLPPTGLSDKDLVFFKNNTDIPVRVSEQQALCLKHLSKGMSAKEIARVLNISYRTVEVYLAQLKEKLECDSSKELISLYLSKH